MTTAAYRHHSQAMRYACAMLALCLRYACAGLRDCVCVRASAIWERLIFFSGHTFQFIAIANKILN